MAKSCIPGCCTCWASRQVCIESVSRVLHMVGGIGIMCYDVLLHLSCVNHSTLLFLRLPLLRLARHRLATVLSPGGRWLWVSSPSQRNPVVEICIVLRPVVAFAALPHQEKGMYRRWRNRQTARRACIRQPDSERERERLGPGSLLETGTRRCTERCMLAASGEEDCACSTAALHLED